jgi:sugar-specific transcriptional regulator TrmB
MGKSKINMTLTDALVLFKEHRPDIRRACIDNIRHAQRINSNAKEMTDEVEWTVENIINHVAWLELEKSTKGAVRTIQRIDMLRKPRSVGGVTDAMIQRAKEQPIRYVYQMLGGDANRHGNVSCPFHDDENPSMSLSKHNRYKCFSCDEGGDTISLYMKMSGVGFLEAVRALQ